MDVPQRRTLLTQRPSPPLGPPDGVARWELAGGACPIEIRFRTRSVPLCTLDQDLKEFTVKAGVSPDQETTLRFEVKRRDSPFSCMRGWVDWAQGWIWVQSFDRNNARLMYYAPGRCGPETPCLKQMTAAVWAQHMAPPGSDPILKFVAMVDAGDPEIRGMLRSLAPDLTARCCFEISRSAPMMCGSWLELSTSQAEEVLTILCKLVVPPPGTFGDKVYPESARCLVRAGITAQYDVVIKFKRKTVPVVRFAKESQ
ncbi:hypothetical protein GGTG_04850 [Gaeumannomyces tritici R3-111a-1]|uniref:Uncharacterized protein n=1 Tax=Gaeumannomyces tritici (strain R3-111a-1) TaxID=644352 RepID=J3NU96_GAET3|nr:hypothetical protein GGTG_04850 [Gaeumannomyces tritici R3-111a-1]EJT79767.1 hypothetical protein GGTG_04850 [Gaeumannomyces tritici R3-111a-1]